MGVKGEPGRDGTPGRNGPMGQKGDVGQKGDAGQKGNYVIGPKGQKGDTGKYGAEGQKGDTGQKGNKGRVGISGSPGRKGEPGPVNTMIFKSAFSVKSAGYKNIRLNHTQPIKYSTVITNIGSDYNLTAAKFVCRVPGAYVFSFTGHNPIGRPLAINIMKNNFRMVTSYSKSSRTSSTSTTVVLELVKGDEVWTKPYSSTQHIIYSNSFAEASFSGFLLYPTT